MESTDGVTEQGTGDADNGTTRPQPPILERPDPRWEHIDLYSKVRDALYVVPSQFRSEINIVDVPLSDLHSFNTAAGAAIEQQAVTILNSLRSLWDPDDRYPEYSFMRQSQRFPDVVLQTFTPKEPRVIMGIELKGWYLLSSEGEPSYRFQATPAVCAPWDLIAMFPWVLGNIVSGSPTLIEPFIIEAKYAALLRNWWWEHKKDSSGSSEIQLSSVNDHYPSKGDHIDDRPRADSGNNFGRLARIEFPDGRKLLDDHKTKVDGTEWLGITITAWRKFLRCFKDGSTQDKIDTSLDRLVTTLGRERLPLAAGDLKAIGSRFREIAEILDRAGDNPLPPSKPRSKPSKKPKETGRSNAMETSDGNSDLMPTTLDEHLLRNETIDEL